MDLLQLIVSRAVSLEAGTAPMREISDGSCWVYKQMLFN
jgi:hypothetical protein